MSKIHVKTPIVEMDGDEMAKILWAMIKNDLILPFVELKAHYYDLGIKHQDETDDCVTHEAANAVMKYGVGVKCANITTTPKRVAEYNLKKLHKSINSTIRALLGVTVFRKPILARNIKPAIPTWEKPIIIGRHAYGDIYTGVEMNISEPGTAEIFFTPSGGGDPIRKTIKEFTGAGVIQAIHNIEDSIETFAAACFSFAYEQKIDLWLSVKDSISKIYDVRFRDIFEEEYNHHWRSKYEAMGIQYSYMEIDNAVARVIRCKGGMLWALKNYDGDIMSDMLASAYGSLGMMSSILVSPKGHFQYEAAHGSVTKHYNEYLKNGEIKTNPTALIFAWSGGLRKRGELDGLEKLVCFANRLEEAAIVTIESGVMTQDLFQVAGDEPMKKKLSTKEFIEAIVQRLKS